jgi:hypothetical protein
VQVVQDDQDKGDLESVRMYKRCSCFELYSLKLSSTFGRRECGGGAASKEAAAEGLKETAASSAWGGHANRRRRIDT